MEREEAIHSLIKAGRWIMDKQMTWGSAGNISLRLNEDELVITASGTRFDSLTPEDFTFCRLSDGLCSGGKPSKELPVHLAVYRAAPWARAVLHASPFHTTLAASSDLPLRNDLFVENMYYLQRLCRIPYAHPGSPALAQAVGEAAPESNVILMKNHGVIVYDETLSEALTGLEVLENTCRMCLSARQSGTELQAVPEAQVRDFLYNSGYRKPRPWMK